VVRVVAVFSRWQLCCPTALNLVISSPSKVEQFSFEYCPLSHETSSKIYLLPHFGRLACCPSPALSLCASLNLCSVLAAPLGGWLVAPSLTLSLCCFSFTESLALRCQLLGQLPFSVAGSVSTPTSTVGVGLQFTVYAFQLCWGRFSLSRDCAVLCSQEVGKGVMHGV
jgi:hypothetical protein